MARNVNVNWEYPTTRESGKPLDPADIAGLELSISVDNATWSVFDNFVHPVTGTQVTELEIGEWFFKGVVKDIQGRASKPSFASVVVPDETAPGTANLTVTLV